MKLTEPECRRLLAGADHGVLATLHPTRGVDAVPVVYALAGDEIVIPIDTIKAKRDGRLRRADNLAGDSRCVLLVEHYDGDWSHLWWVRMHARGTATHPTAAAVEALSARYPAYETPNAITQMLVLSPTGWYGWQAGDLRC